MEEFRQYTLNEPFQNKNAGFSRWTTGKRGGREYFLKEFLNPVFPTDFTLAADLRTAKVKICQEYEDYTKELLARVNAASDGNIVRVLEFFREGAHYYEVSERVTNLISLSGLAEGPMQDRLMVCYLLAHSIARLHEEGVVHADVKETNVLLHRTPAGKIVPKLIDFGSSYLESRPVSESDDLGGDQLYLAPEAFLFILGEEKQPGKEIDDFALGLLMHQYLTGKLPDYDTKEYLYPYESVLDDHPLGISDKLTGEIRQMVNGLLEGEPAQRLSAKEAEKILHAALFPGMAFRTESAQKKPDESRHAPAGDKKKNRTMDDFFHMAGDL